MAEKRMFSKTITKSDASIEIVFPLATAFSGIEKVSATIRIIRTICVLGVFILLLLSISDAAF